MRVQEVAYVRVWLNSKQVVTLAGWHRKLETGFHPTYGTHANYTAIVGLMPSNKQL